MRELCIEAIADIQLLSIFFLFTAQHEHFMLAFLAIVDVDRIYDRSDRPEGSYFGH